MVWKLLLKVRVERSGVYTRASGLKIDQFCFPGLNIEKFSFLIRA